MFSKNSRYRKVPDVVTTDSKGRKLKSRNFRLLPEVSGDFFHTVEEIDRLDHLAYKYYKQSRKWWRICDANPEFMSSQALLGKEAIVTVRFPLTFKAVSTIPEPEPKLGELPADGLKKVTDITVSKPSDKGVSKAPEIKLKQPPWAELLRKLSEEPGIEDVKVIDDIHLIPVGETHNDQEATVYRERYERAVIVTYNQMNLQTEDIDAIIKDSGFEPGQPENIDRVGKKIVIPPNVVG